MSQAVNFFVAPENRLIFRYRSRANEGILGYGNRHDNYAA